MAGEVSIQRTYAPVTGDQTTFVSIQRAYVPIVEGEPDIGPTPFRRRQVIFVN